MCSVKLVNSGCSILHDFVRAYTRVHRTHGPVMSMPSRVLRTDFTDFFWYRFFRSISVFLVFKNYFLVFISVCYFKLATHVLQVSVAEWLARLTAV